MIYTKTIKYLTENYPSIRWALIKPADDVEKNFGAGIVLQGRYEDKEESFFILNEDKNRERWGDIIAAKLIGTEIENA